MKTCEVCGLPVPETHPFGHSPVQFTAIMPTPEGLRKIRCCSGYHSPQASGKSHWWQFDWSVAPSDRTSAVCTAPQREPVPAAFHAAFAGQELEP